MPGGNQSACAEGDAGMGREASAKGAVSGKGLGITKEPRLSRSQHLQWEEDKACSQRGEERGTQLEPASHLLLCLNWSGLG